MPNKARFIVAESRIKSFFTDGPKKVFSKEELNGIFEEYRGQWNLPVSMTGDKFIQRLLSRNILELREIVFDGYVPRKERFMVPGSSLFQLAVSLVKKSYLSHFTAAFLQGLTVQVPKTIYISFEQTKKQDVDRELKQSAIDGAFSKPQRQSGATSIVEGLTFLMHNGMYTGRTGVYELQDLPVTNIERTLIDITVRPNYAGGVHSVLDIYKAARDKISVNKLLATLDKMNFIYPYHQSIGFYLQRAGMNTERLEPLIRKKKEFDFYLTYEMADKDYDPSWKLYYPKGM